MQEASQEGGIMLIQIIKHTPPWVFVLFFVLLAFGYFQHKDRTYGLGKVAILPMVMIALSFWGVLSAFAISFIGILCWAIGIGTAALPGIKINRPQGVLYSPQTKLVSVPGSWIPLIVMMTIFFIKYTVGVIHARRLPVMGEPIFIAVISLCYGVLSGIFLARAVVIWRAARAN